MQAFPKINALNSVKNKSLFTLKIILVSPFRKAKNLVEKEATKEEKASDEKPKEEEKKGVNEAVKEDNKTEEKEKVEAAKKEETMTTDTKLPLHPIIFNALISKYEKINDAKEEKDIKPLTTDAKLPLTNDAKLPLTSDTKLPLHPIIFHALISKYDMICRYLTTKRHLFKFKLEFN